jgi:hypothetical protein
MQPSCSLRFGVLVGAAILLAGCKPALPPDPDPGEQAWAASHPLEGRDAASLALGVITINNGACSRIDDFADNGPSNGGRIFIARCDADRTRFQLTETRAGITAKPLAITDADIAAIDDDNEQLDGAYGARVALKTINELIPDTPCKTLTGFKYLGRGSQLGDGTKLYAAQCDGPALYGLEQNGGRTQVLRMPADGAKN